MARKEFDAQALQTVQSRLQALRDDLPPHQGEILDALLAHAATATSSEPSGTSGEERSIIIVGGSGRTVLRPDPRVLDGITPPLPVEVDSGPAASGSG